MDAMYSTRAIVDLAAVRHNLEQARALAGGRKVLVAVKANAYGHGAVEVARMVERTGCADWLGVATVPEGIELREAGVRLPVLKLSHCFPDEVEAAFSHDLSLAVVDAESIMVAQQVAARLGGRHQVQLKLDTGMRRIGAEPQEAIRLARLVTEQPNLHLQGVFTHLPVSDMGGEDDLRFTRDELAAFREAVRAVQREVGPVELVHATPSGGLLQHDLAEMTMVRPGIMAYGYYPDASTERTVDLRPAMSLVGRVSFVKKVPRGESVGYGRTWTAPQDTWIATVPVGYADGYSRLNSNRGRMLVHGRSYPIAGRVCMDQTMIDLGPELPRVQVGDEVVLLGRSGDEVIDADELAAVMGTISYEVTCLVAPRVTRTHVDEDWQGPGSSGWG